MSEANKMSRPCCTEDEGRSLGAVFQEEASNHQKGLLLRAMVLSILVIRKGRSLFN
jgi:hypothetical protein